MKTIHARHAVFCLVALLVIWALGSSARVEGDVQPANQYHITNPYANVDWAEYGRYKANFHTHSTNSDGGFFARVMVETYYARGYDILALTDHSYLSASWDAVKLGKVSAERSGEIQAGADRDGRPMICVENTNEQSQAGHINTFWAPFNNAKGDSMSTVLRKAEALGGISHINHPGRYTGGSDKNDRNSLAASNKPEVIKKYADFFMEYPSCVGMEIINKLDIESKSDRVLWDNVLKKTMPEGRFVWGFSGDDAHSLDAAGYAWNVLLMPELNQAEIRKAMETGAFYAVSRVSRLDNINRKLPNGSEMPEGGRTSTLYLLEQPTPSVTSITVSGSTIAIVGADYQSIAWIADGIIIATGNVIDLSDYPGKIKRYVRAQLMSGTGIAFTQPFGVREAGEGVQ